MTFTTTTQPTATLAPSEPGVIARPSFAVLGTGVGELQLAFTFPLLGLFLVGVAAVLALLTSVRDWLSDAVAATRVADRLSDDEPESTAGIPSAARLSEEEQFVVDLLRRNEGRIRQSNIVELSDWSKSKVSRLLSTMEAEGYIEKVAVGRENIIVLPGEEPER
ncbi:helix-turn-helix transcriptional regulator [Haloglomus salinum]|jgi:hypothetical protein|uniref:helix-turn-helix transcriptional regulator n=1 Tax=Haloglomus salinum TaxID=2962673 RepID=UPI0020C9DBF0|nr:helix-turn-helix domain-containing protein [Haloglomus salinum]